MTPRKRGPRAEAISQFLALMPVITAKLAAGRKRRALYDEHRQALGISYAQFTRYVARHITGTAKQPPRAEDRHSKGSPRPQAPHSSGPIATPAAAQKTFAFDPTRALRPGRDQELI